MKPRLFHFQVPYLGCGKLAGTLSTVWPISLNFVELAFGNVMKCSSTFLKAVVRAGISGQCCSERTSILFHLRPWLNKIDHLLSVSLRKGALLLNDSWWRAMSRNSRRVPPLMLWNHLQCDAPYRGHLTNDPAIRVWEFHWHSRLLVEFARL